MRECDALGDARKCSSSDLVQADALSHTAGIVLSYNGMKCHAGNIIRALSQKKFRILSFFYDKAISQYRKIARRNRAVEPVFKGKWKLFSSPSQRDIF